MQQMLLRNEKSFIWYCWDESKYLCSVWLWSAQVHYIFAVDIAKLLKNYSSKLLAWNQSYPDTVAPKVASDVSNEKLFGSF